MTKLTYAQQLLHPNWQRKRLEILSNNGFQCQICFDENNTLHVHHKAYKKGAMAWEYENDNFLCLCKDCHESVHEEKDLINDVLKDVDPIYYGMAAALLDAFFSGDRRDVLYHKNPYAYEAGLIADAVVTNDFNMNDIIEMRKAIYSWTPNIDLEIKIKGFIKNDTQL